MLISKEEAFGICYRSALSFVLTFSWLSLYFQFSLSVYFQSVSLIRLASMCIGSILFVNIHRYWLNAVRGYCKWVSSIQFDSVDLVGVLCTFRRLKVKTLIQRGTYTWLPRRTTDSVALTTCEWLNECISHCDMVLMNATTCGRQCWNIESEYNRMNW